MESFDSFCTLHFTHNAYVIVKLLNLIKKEDVNLTNNCERHYLSIEQ